MKFFLNQVFYSLIKIYLIKFSEFSFSCADKKTKQKTSRTRNITKATFQIFDLTGAKQILKSNRLRKHKQTQDKRIYKYTNHS